jgi:hypothetical protein
MLALTIGMQNSLFEVFEQLLTARIEGAIAAGIYDRGLETLAADSLTVKERRAVYTHPATGAQTRIFTIARRDRNRPLTLEDALSRAQGRGGRLLLNARSHRAAVEVPAPSLMLVDGSIERRVRLLRPMEQHSFAKAALAETLWEEAGREAFAKAWQEEIASLPEFTESTFHIATGLLLPIWRRLPDENCRVYRLQTDDGERIVGRLVSLAALGVLCRNLGLDDAPALSPDEAWQLLLDGKSVVQLADGLQLRRVRVMNDHRIELTGFTPGMRERLSAMGLTHEIISWKLRFFIPASAGGPAILGRLMARHPLTGIAERAAA